MLRCLHRAVERRSSVSAELSSNANNANTANNPDRNVTPYTEPNSNTSTTDKLEVTADVSATANDDTGINVVTETVTNPTKLQQELRNTKVSKSYLEKKIHGKCKIIK